MRWLIIRFVIVLALMQLRYVLPAIVVEATGLIFFSMGMFMIMAYASDQWHIWKTRKDISDILVQARKDHHHEHG